MDKKQSLFRGKKKRVGNFKQTLNYNPFSLFICEKKVSLQNLLNQ